MTINIHKKMSKEVSDFKKKQKLLKIYLKTVKNQILKI